MNTFTISEECEILQNINSDAALYSFVNSLNPSASAFIVTELDYSFITLAEMLRLKGYSSEQYTVIPLDTNILQIQQRIDNISLKGHFISTSYVSQEINTNTLPVTFALSFPYLTPQQIDNHFYLAYFHK